MTGVIGIVGAGSWGTALAWVLGTKGLDVTLWARDAKVARGIEERRRNPNYLPEVELPRTVSATSDIASAVEGKPIVFHVVPSHATRATARLYAKHLRRDTILVSAAKGLEEGTLLRMSEVLKAETGFEPAVLTGPNHAEEIGRGDPAAAIAAHADGVVSKRVTNALATRAFKVYPSPDVVGAETCAAFKNVVAIASGMSYGLGLGDNAAAALMTLGLHEMYQVTVEAGGHPGTVAGLAGVGDLIATCASKHSRNRFVGDELARGEPLEKIVEKMHGMVAEGVKAARAFHEYGRERRLTVPLTDEVFRTLYEGKKVRAALDDLLEAV